MRSIAIINQKGGVGKTTTAVNLSAALAEAGQKVWLIDLDPQAHASLHLGFGMESDYLSMYDVLTDLVSLDDVRHLVQPNLWLSPSHIDLAAAEMELAGAVGREIILRDKMAEVTEEFDYIIFDCPPSLGILTLNGLTTSQEVFLPLQPHFLALHGLSKLLRTIELVARRLNSTLRLSSVVYCLYDTGTRLANEVVNDVEVFFEAQRTTSAIWAEAGSFDTRIRRNIRLAEAPSYGQSIFQYAGDSHGAQDYRSLAAEVMRQTITMDQCPKRQPEVGAATAGASDLEPMKSNPILFASDVADVSDQESFRVISANEKSSTAEEFKPGNDESRRPPQETPAKKGPAPNRHPYYHNHFNQAR